MPTRMTAVVEVMEGCSILVMKSVNSEINTGSLMVPSKTRDDCSAMRVCKLPNNLNLEKTPTNNFTLEPSSCLKTVDGGDDQDRFLGGIPSCLSRFWSWAAWLLSVLVVSSLLSTWTSSSSPMMPVSSPQASQQTEAVVEVSSSPLRKRAATCTSGGVDGRVYNLPLHVGALFIILCVSSLACAFPILASKFPGLRIPGRFFFAVRHFGTGVLIATAFVHLFPTAFISLGNPCLNSFWTQDYPAMPGAIALAAIFFVTIVEMVFHPSRHIPPPQPSHCLTSGGEAPRNHGCMGSAATMLPVRDMGPLRGRSTSIGQGLSRIETENNETGRQDQAMENSTPSRPKESFEETTIESLQVHDLSPELKQRKELLQCVLLELGILFHSIFIGMALSVSIGNEFIILLIAIVFHRKLDSLTRSEYVLTDVIQKRLKVSLSGPELLPSSGHRVKCSPG